MIEQHFDPHQPLRYVDYGRMSREEQNPRSPDQQFDTIERTRVREGFTQWVKVASFRDDGISGRLKRKRAGFSTMIDSIRSGMLKVDLILVDTLERLGRLDDLQAIRDELRKRYGVLVLTADTRFADPMSTMGRLYGTMEAVRASSEGRKKAHDVLRGKIDTAMMKHWPGGPPNCGYRLEARIETLTRRSGKSVDKVHHVLVPDPETAPIPKRIYELAHQHGWGRSRIAKNLNRNEDFVNRFGKVSESLVGSILSNTVYKGVFRFNFLATDIEDDCRIIRRKDPDEVLYIEEFCEPLVDAAVVESVHAAARTRSEAHRSQTAAGHDKHIHALTPGLSLVYPLAGLIRCGKCNAAMVPTKSGAVSKSAACYYYYRCPSAMDGRCENKRYLRGRWIWETVVSLLRDELFPQFEDQDKTPDWLPELMAEVGADLQDRFATKQNDRPLLERELQQIEEKRKGWSESLASSQLSHLVRREIEAQFEKGLHRKQEIESLLDQIDSSDTRVETLVDKTAMLDRISHLHEVLAGANASDMNIELFRHIESIQFHPDLSVTIRATRLGVFDDVAGFLANDSSTDAPTDGNHYQVTPRCLSRRRTTGAESGPLDRPAGLVDNSRQLPDRWVTKFAFHMPELISWSEEHAIEVAEQRKSGATHEELAEQFGVTTPTIRQALKHAKKLDPSLSDLPKKMPRSRWHEEYANAVAAKAAEGLSTVELAAYFGKSDTTIRKALNAAGDQATA